MSELAIIQRADGYVNLPPGPQGTTDLARRPGQLARIPQMLQGGSTELGRRGGPLARIAGGGQYYAPFASPYNLVYGPDDLDENGMPRLRPEDQLIRDALSTLFFPTQPEGGPVQVDDVRSPSFVFSTVPSLSGDPVVTSSASDPDPPGRGGRTNDYSTINQGSPGPGYGYLEPPVVRPGAAAGYDALTGEDVTASAVDSMGDLFQNEWDKHQALLNMDLDDIKASYGDDISALDKVMGDLKNQAGLTEAAYKGYRGAIDAAVSPVETEALPDDTTAAEVQKVYDDAEGATLEALEQIDADFSPEVAIAATEQLTYMEGFIQDSLRVDINNVDAMHEATAEAAARLSSLAFANSSYDAAKSQMMMKAQFEKAVNDQAEIIAAKKAAMNGALDRRNARAALEWDGYEYNFEESFGVALLDYFGGAGLTSHETSTLMELFERIKSTDDAAMLNEGNWSTAMARFNNTWILEQLGVDDSISAWRQSQQNEVENNLLSDELALQRFDRLDSWLEKMDLGELFQGNAAKASAGLGTLEELGILDANSMQLLIKDGTENADQWMLHGDDGWDQLRDAYTFSQEFEKNWNDIKAQAEAEQVIATEAPKDYKSGGTASSNYNHRFAADYVYRRETTAPYYANAVKQNFSGVTIGGLGYMRPPGDVGGGKIANSDHQSGGAIDVYSKLGSAATTNAELLKIAAWFRQQPGISYVTYEGQGAHQTGTSNAHVHVSFQVGWKVP